MKSIEDLFGFKGKVVVVTGAAGQLGSTLCQAFRDAGAKVYGTDKTSEAGELIDLDITSNEQVVKVLTEIAEREGRIDVLVNNAGVACFEPFEERSESNFDWVMDVNLKGTFFCTRAYAELARAKRFKGSIVNIGSIYGVVSADFRIYTDCARKSSEVYGATKAGVIQMSKYFAVHLAAAGIRVNCVSPGGIFNPKNPQGPDFVTNYSQRCPMGRMADAKEMVGAVFYLASDAASYTTGQNIVVDGGFSAW